MSKGRYRRPPRQHLRKVNFNSAAQAQWFLLVGDLLTVGFSLQRALAFTGVVMRRQQPVIAAVNARLRAGETFADSVRAFVKPDLYYQLMLAEEHGELITTLNEIGQLLVTKHQQRQKLQRLLQYPLLLLFLLGVLIVGLSVYVFPELASWQAGGSEAGGQLRPILIGVAAFLIIFVALAGAGMVVHWYRLGPDQRVDWLCRLPIVGKCYRLYYGYYIASTLAILLRCGMSLKEILGVIEQFSPRSLLFCLGKEAQRQVQDGGELDDLIRKHHFLPGELAVMVHKGMTVEELGADFNMLAKMQFKRLLVQLGELFTLVQPVIFIIIALVIVGLYLSILLPIYQSIQRVY